MSSIIKAHNTTIINIIIKNPNKANKIANGNQNKQKHHHQEILITPVIFNIHNKAVINKGQPPIFTDTLSLLIFL